MGEEEEIFQIVARRKRGNRLRGVISNHNTIDKLDEPEFHVDQLIRKLNKFKDELNASDYKKILFRKLSEATEVLNFRSINNVVCYGLGHFSEHKHSRFQLALLIIIKEYFEAKVYVYDPLFFTYEIDFLESIDCRVIKENEEGKRTIESETLVYLPHCPKQLTNNFLYANWGPGLKNCILFSNSFKVILESHTDAAIGNTAGYIARINPFANEIELPNCFEHRNVFNDSAIHVFTQENLSHVPNGFWRNKEEPKYLEEDIEFIAKSINQKLKL